MRDPDEKFEGETASADSDKFIKGDLRDDGSVANLEAKVLVAEDAESDGPQLEVGDVEAKEFEAPDVGDESLGYRVESTIGTADIEFPFVLELVFARQGRIGVSTVLSFIGSGSAPSAVVKRALRAMLERADQ